MIESTRVPPANTAPTALASQEDDGPAAPKQDVDTQTRGPTNENPMPPIGAEVGENFAAQREPPIGDNSAKGEDDKTETKPKSSSLKEADVGSAQGAFGAVEDRLVDMQDTIREVAGEISKFAEEVLTVIGDAGGEIAEDTIEAFNGFADSATNSMNSQAGDGLSKIIEQAGEASETVTEQTGETISAEEKQEQAERRERREERKKQKEEATG